MKAPLFKRINVSPTKMTKDWKSMKSVIRAGLATLAAFTICVGAAQAAGGAYPVKYPEKQSWTFGGMFGTFDRAQLQRGYKVYREVCANCHAMQYLAFRNLAQAGGPEFSEAEAKQIASEYQIVDGPDDAGDMFERPGILADHFPSPFENKNQAMASNNGAYPVDLSLIAKSRSAAAKFPQWVINALPGVSYNEYGADYIYGLLTGYKEDYDQEHYEVGEGLYYNEGFINGYALAMAPPLSDEIVDYTDGTPMTVDQYSRDVAAFLMWAAEPKMEERKFVGFIVIMYLIVFSGFLYATKRLLWAKVEH